MCGATQSPMWWLIGMQCTPLCSTQNSVLSPVDDAGDRSHPVIVSFMLQPAELDAASCCGLLLGFLILHVDVTSKHIQEGRVRRALMTDTDMLRNNHIFISQSNNPGVWNVLGKKNKKLDVIHADVLKGSRVFHCVTCVNLWKVFWRTLLWSGCMTGSGTEGEQQQSAASRYSLLQLRLKLASWDSTCFLSLCIHGHKGLQFFQQITYLLRTKYLP